jgi:hypothetical protein
VGDPAQGDDHRAGGQDGELALEVAVAAANLVRGGPVRGRQALHRVRDAAIGELEAVAARQGNRVRGEARGVQRCIQQDARVVARERPPGAVGPVQSRRKADDEQARPTVAERRDGPAVVGGMLGGDAVEMARKPGAEPAAWLEGRTRRAARALQRALNCASSVDPRIAVMDELPPVTVCVTSSK